MTEAEFLASDDPRAVLRHLEGAGGASGRKLRLFAAACARVRCAGDAGALAEIEADEAGSDRDPVPDLSRRVAQYAFDVRNLHFAPDVSARFAALLRCVFGNPWRPVKLDAPACVCSELTRWPVKACPRCCVVSEPPPCLTPAVVALAREAYATRQFGAMPVLADLLEEAGCAVPEVLVHLRGYERCADCLGEGYVSSEGWDGEGALQTACIACNSPVTINDTPGWHKIDAPVYCRGDWVIDLILGLS